MKLRLEFKRKKARGKPGVQCALNLQRARGGLVHAALEEAVCAAASALRFVNGCVRVLEQRFHGVAVARIKRDADARHDLQRLRIGPHGLAHPFEHGFGQCGGVFARAQVLRQHHEFVAVRSG
jgi:hypothetical protein